MSRNKVQRMVAAGLSLSLMLSVNAAAGNCTYDEAYYVNLDYYGAVRAGNMVKSYSLNGETRIADLGSYESIKNMTNYVSPEQGEGKVVFDFGQDAPDRFYFEGKTAEPLTDLPWSIQVSYKLNGVPVQADRLAGAQGLVEMALDLVPNPNAREYYRNNMVLTATAAVDADKMLSIEAEGALVQSVGNVKAIVFLALPGEQQHFVVRLGTDRFAFGGWVFLMNPATLGQLSDISKLRADKQTVEDAANAVSRSLDVILDTSSALGGSFSSAASGLDALDDARQSVADGKAQAYEDADRALADLQSLTERIRPFDRHLANASDAVSMLRQELNAMNATINELQPALEKLQKAASSSGKSLAELSDFMTYLDDNRFLLRSNIGALKTVVTNASSAVSAIQASIDPGSLDAYIAGTSAANDSNAYVLAVQKQTLAAIKTLLASTAPVLTETADLTAYLDDILEEVDDEYSGTLSGLAEDLRAGTAGLDSTLGVMRKTIDNVNRLNALLNAHHDGLMRSIGDCRSLIDTVQTGTSDLHTFLAGAESLLKTSGGKLDAGTKATLEGLSDALRKSANGLQQSGVIKNAKNTVKELVDDKWEEYTGEDNNMLLMDAQAPLQSLTSAENSAPSSLQILLRTDEITAADEDETDDIDESFRPEGDLLTRIGSIFHAIWRAVAGAFQ